MHTPSCFRTRDAWWTVGVLGASYALAQTGSTLMITVTGLTGVLLAGSSALATLPLAVQFLAMTVATVPAAALTSRTGWRLGFSAGQLLGAISAALAAVAVVRADFWLFVAASGGIGFHNAVWQRLRFAAGDAVAPERRARAISYLLGGGIVAAVLGPWLATHSRDLLSSSVFAGSFVALSGLCLLNALVLQAGRLKSRGAEAVVGKGWQLRALARQPAVVVAVLSAAIGYGAMILVMTATPLAVTACGFTFQDAAWVIQWHVLAMYAPSFLTGKLIERYGAARVIAAGAALNVFTALVNVSGMSTSHFWLGLVSLGVAWNLMFIGGTTLLAETCRPDDRVRVQGFNDLVVFGVAAAASLSSGMLYATVGWAALNSLVATLAMIALLAVAVLVRHQRAAPAPVGLQNAS